MLQFYRELIKEYFQNSEENADYPLPSEDSLGVFIPEDSIISIGAGSRLAAYMEDSSKEDSKKESSPVIRINFQNDLSPAFVLAEHIPQKLLETCFFKIRNYLRQYGNKEYAFHKLLVQLRSKEPSLKEMLNKILTRTHDCYNIFTEGGEFSYLFWSYFCALLKNEIQQKFRLSTDNAVLQAVHIIETLNGYYKSLAAKTKEKEVALRRIELNIAKPPYIYTLDKIMKFTNTSGTPLLKFFTREEFSGHIKNLSSSSDKKSLPELLVFKDQKNELHFVMKNMVLLLCSRLIMENRNNLRQAVLKYWFRLIKNYQNEAAMESDEAFEQTLYEFTENLCPILNVILKDPKFFLICQEQPGKRDNNSIKFYSKGSLLPYSSLFSIKRKDLLEDIRLFLPFWYSIPFVVTLFAYFQRLGGRTVFKESNLSEKYPVAHPLINQAPASVYFPNIIQYKMKRQKY